MFRRFFLPLLLALPLVLCAEDAAWLDFPGAEGPGKGKSVVFVTGEEVDRSEESAPMLARLLAERHGFRTTVLFAVGKEKGWVDPNTVDNIPNLAALDGADMMVMMLRFREPPEEDMGRFAAFFKAGKPLLSVRSSTHAFAFTKDRRAKFRRWDWQSEEWPGGFGKRITGASWVSQPGRPGVESTRGLLRADAADHPILRGIGELWCPSAAHAVDLLPENARVLADAVVLAGMNPGDPPAGGARNHPTPPLVWTREYRLPDDGKPGLVIVSTAGSAEDLLQPGLRRLFVNSVFFGCGLEEFITPELSIEPVSEYKPSPSGFNKFRREVKPKDF